VTKPSTDIFAPTCALVCVFIYVAAYFILLGLRSDRDKQFAELERLRGIEVAARALLDSNCKLGLHSEAWERLINALAAKETP